MDTTSILAHVSKHIALDHTEADFFLSLLQPRTLKRRDFLLRPGEVAQTENFVVKGCLRTFTLDAQGNERILSFGIEDWWVGDLYSFLTQSPATYYIEAVEDSQVLQISKQDLENLYERVPKFDRFFRLILQNAFIAQQQRIEQNLSLTAEERYLDFRKRYPGLEQRLTQKQISAYLGITPVFLSMVRRKLSQS